MPILMSGKVKEVSIYDGEMGPVLQVFIFTDLSKTGADDWSELLEVPSTEENRKTFVAGATVTGLPVKVWAKRKKDGGAWVKYTAASQAA